MAAPLLKPGDIPAPMTSRERRLLTAAEAEDTRRQINFRPNQAFSSSRFDRCAMSKYSSHRFVANLGRTCEFCQRDYRDCLLAGGVE